MPLVDDDRVRFVVCPVFVWFMVLMLADSLNCCDTVVVV